jgi:hypothetical protein
LALYIVKNTENLRELSPENECKKPRVPLEKFLPFNFSFRKNFKVNNKRLSYGKGKS